MHNMNKARVEKIKKEKDDLIRQLEALRNTTVTQMWSRELDEFLQEYKKYKEKREKIASNSTKTTSTSTIKKISKKK